MSSPGKVWLVGAGPGDPSLITVRGRQVLAAADVVLFDALSHPSLLEVCRSDAELRDVGKRGGSRSPSQNWITAQLIELALAGKRVVRLKGGDPSLFARGAEEALALSRASVPFEVVPGVSSPVAAAAYTGIPLTHRYLSSSVTFITGSDRAGKAWSPEAWQRLALATDTICVLMGMHRIEAITRALIEGGRSAETPVAVVQWAARPEQRVVTAPLASIARAVREAGLSNPALIVIGDVVSLRGPLSWFESQPLFGRRLLVPRPAHQAMETAEAIRDRGAHPVLLPAIEIGPAPDPEALVSAARRLGSYDYCVFTSSNGVDRFFAALRAASLDARAFGSCRIAAIGPRTARALEPRGVRADLVAREFVAESLARDLLATGPLRRVLLPRALVAREELPRLLRAAGVQVDVVPAYVTSPASGSKRLELAALLRERRLDAVLLSSSSMVDAIVDSLGRDATDLLGRVALASIGPITTATLRRHGLSADVTAERYTMSGLLDALSHHFQPSVTPLSVSPSAT